MHKKLEFWGVVGTVAYLLIIVMTVAFKFSSFVALELNELGDFLAGAFGPVAFLWLVLGFLQQGRELKLSSEALQLQAKELKNSVEQQTIMAQAAMQQIESQRASLRLKELEVERSLSPIFRIGYGLMMRDTGGGYVETSIQIFNDGPDANKLAITFEPAIGSLSSCTIDRVPRGASGSPINFKFLCPDTDIHGACSISYQRADGKRTKEEFDYMIKSDSPFVLMEKKIPDFNHAT